MEHLLRNVKDANISTLATDVSAKLAALQGLSARLADIQAYLGGVAEGRLPVNPDIMMHLQVGGGWVGGEWVGGGGAGVKAVCVGGGGSGGATIRRWRG